MDYAGGPIRDTIDRAVMLVEMRPAALMSAMHPGLPSRKQHAFDSSAPIPAVRGTAMEPPNSARNRRSGWQEHDDSPLWQAGEAQAGDPEFPNFWCRKVKVLAKAGDGQLGVDGKHSTEFGARRVEMAEMRQRGDFDPHC